MGTILGRHGPENYILWIEDDLTYTVLVGEKGDECVIVKRNLTREQADKLIAELQKI